jgi:hypothetical protein
MEAGYGALTLIRSPCPVRGCPLLASLAATRVPKIGVVQAGKEKRNAATDEYGRACQPPWKSLASGRSAEPFGTTFLPARLAVVQGIVARMEGDCPAGSRRHDKSTVPALPGCAVLSFWNTFALTLHSSKPKITTLDCQKNIA